MTFRFVGACAELADLVLSRFGEQVELEQSVAEAAVVHDHVALIPEPIWAQCGITTEEQQKYYSTDLHPLAPPAFIAKRDAVWTAFRDYRTQLTASHAGATKEGE
jgi:hypothetical protein